MDFSKLKGVDASNTRKGGTFVKEQSYDNLKYRRAAKKVKNKDGTTSVGEVEGRFYVSNPRFAEWDIEGSNGLKMFTDSPDDLSKATMVALAVVPNEQATMLKPSKRGKKTKNFKSTRFETVLSSLGIIDTSVTGSQFLDLFEDPKGAGIEVDGVKVVKMYTLSKGKSKTAEKKAEVKTANVAATPQAAPQAAPAPAAAPEVAKTDADW